MALERRISTGSRSPSWARMSAIRSIVALNQIASPAVARAMISLRPCSEARPSRTKTFACGGFCFLFGSHWISLIDGRLEQGLQPAPGHRAESWCELSVDRAGLGHREMASGVGDATGLVGRHLTCLGCHPD